MADNTTLPGATKIIRDIDRANAGVKTQVAQIDIGGGNANAEVLVVAGQKAMSASVPVVVASDQSALPVTAASLPLPAGASTSAAQTTGNASAASIDAKAPALGQALGAASVPVVLTAAQVITLTPPAAIAGFSTEATLALIKAKTDNLDVALSTRAVTGLTDAQIRATSLPVSGPLTDTQLRAAAVPISLATAPTTPVTGTFFQSTQPVSLASAPVTAVTDNAGSLTVDAPVATPVFVRLSDGAAAVVPLVAADLTSGAAREQLFDVQLNQTALISSLRHLIAGSVTRIFGDSFADGIGSGEEDAGAFPATATVTGTATGTAANGQLTMTTGATGGATGSLQSTNALPFITGAVANSQNGMTFPSANLTAFRVVSRRAGVDTAIESSAFNVVPTAITNSGLSNALAGSLVNAVLHRCDIFYQGNSAVFAIDGVVVHRMSAQIAAPRTDSLDFPTFFEWSSTVTPTATLRAGQYNATNGYFFECQYNVANVTMTCRGSSANRLGPAPRTQKVLQGYDAARTRVVIKFEAVAPATGDTLLSIVKQTAGVDAGGATSIGVTSNKVLRITGGQISCKSNAAAAAWSTLTLRSNPAGATVIGSPSWGRHDTGLTQAVANDSNFTFFNFDEAQEFSGAQTFGMSLAASAITNIMSIVLYGYEYNIGN